MKITKQAKDTIQIISAQAMLVVGVGFAVAGFLVDPLGEIHDSVLWMFAQCLIYSGTAMGITYYVRQSHDELRNELGIKGKSDEDTDR